MVNLKWKLQNDKERVCKSLMRWWFYNWCYTHGKVLIIVLKSTNLTYIKICYRMIKKGFVKVYDKFKMKTTEW